MNLHKLYLTENECYKAGKKIAVKGIMVHSTGANNPKLSRYVGPDDGKLGANPYGNHWNTYNPGGREVCVHAFIGKLKDGSIATYQTLPWDHRGWHAGGSANNTHIGFEICEDGLTDAKYFAKVYQEAVELCAYLCKMFGLDPLKNIIDHSEGARKGIASAHGDVAHWFPKHGKNMDKFRAAVKAEMDKAAGTATSPAAPEATAQLYRIRKTWADAKSQTGAYKNLDNAKKACAAGFKVFDKDGKVVYDPALGEKPATQEPAKEYPQFQDKTKANGIKYKVKAEGGLNLRAGAGVLNPKTGTENTILGTLPDGSTVTWYGFYSTVYGTDWYWVKTADGRSGFVSSKYLK